MLLRRFSGSRQVVTDFSHNGFGGHLTYLIDIWTQKILRIYCWTQDLVEFWFRRYGSQISSRSIIFGKSDFAACRQYEPHLDQWKQPIWHWIMQSTMDKCVTNTKWCAYDLLIQMKARRATVGMLENNDATQPSAMQKQHINQILCATGSCLSHCPRFWLSRANFAMHPDQPQH